ncbi:MULTISPECIES: hypothetical protein [Rhizobium/Agrobacterium group]|uniref:Uncharacterized protein n=1 Tax=Rhizobium rhizogenes TaxID=359 RepID=A0A546WYR4_RHIRH|nr:MULTISPECIES: hypothetical protein [Rhizobium/Agrobacterium group]TRA93666.1 hypothetical protein EXN68_27160 [Rhizobium rhizogenes]
MSRRHRNLSEDEQAAPSDAACSVCRSCAPEFVTIPLADYIRLNDESRQLAEWHLNNRQLIKPSRSLITRDPEVAVFLANGFGLKSVARLLKECKKKFGAARTPSQNSAYRYWESIRINERSKRNKIVAK